MLDLRWVPVTCIAFFRRLFLKAFLKGFLVIFGGFGGPKMVEKGVFVLTSVAVGFGRRFWSDFGSDFGFFGEARPPIRIVNTNTKRMSAFFGP